MCEVLRTVLYWTIVLSGASAFAYAAFRLEHLIEHPKKRVGDITRARTERR